MNNTGVKTGSIIYQYSISLLRRGMFFTLVPTRSGLNVFKEMVKRELTDRGRLVAMIVIALVLFASAVPVIVSDTVCNPRWYIYNVAWMLFIMPSCVWAIWKIIFDD